LPSTSNHTATGHRPNSNVNSHTSDDFVPEVIAFSDGLSVRLEFGCSYFIPKAEIPYKTILTGPKSIAVSIDGDPRNWVHIPNGITKDDRIHRKNPTMTIIPIELLDNGILPPFPVVTNVPSINPRDGTTRPFRIDSVPPPIPNNNVPPTNPTKRVPTAIHLNSIPSDNPIHNAPINMETLIIISDDEDDADNMNTNVSADVQNDTVAAVTAADVYNEVHNDAYNDIDMEAIEAKENFVIQST